MLNTHTVFCSEVFTSIYVPILITDNKDSGEKKLVNPLQYAEIKKRGWSHLWCYIICIDVVYNACCFLIFRPIGPVWKIPRNKFFFQPYFKSNKHFFCYFCRLSSFCFRVDGHNLPDSVSQSEKFQKGPKLPSWNWPLHNEDLKSGFCSTD